MRAVLIVVLVVTVLPVCGSVTTICTVSPVSPPCVLPDAGGVQLGDHLFGRKAVFLGDFFEAFALGQPVLDSLRVCPARFLRGRQDGLLVRPEP